MRLRTGTLGGKTMTQKLLCNVTSTQLRKIQEWVKIGFIADNNKLYFESKYGRIYLGVET